MKIVAVIPAYNEEKNIERVVRGLKPHVSEVVLVDDGSSDLTGERASRAGAWVLTHAINRGQGAALATGMKFAVDNLNADIVINYDADGQHSSAEIDAIVKPIMIGRADVVLGSRFLNDRSNVPFFRRMVLKAGIIFSRITSGLKITDTHNGFRAFTSEAAKKIRITQDRMAHASEILDEIGRNNLRYVEVPVTIRYTKESMEKGQSSLGAIKIVFDYLAAKLFR